MVFRARKSDDCEESTTSVPVPSTSPRTPLGAAEYLKFDHLGLNFGQICVTLRECRRPILSSESGVDEVLKQTSPDLHTIYRVDEFIVHIELRNRQEPPVVGRDCLCCVL
jgi:hypothetical protein